MSVISCSNTQMIIVLPNQLEYCDILIQMNMSALNTPCERVRSRKCPYRSLQQSAEHTVIQKSAFKSWGAVASCIVWTYLRALFKYIFSVGCVTGVAKCRGERKGTNSLFFFHFCARWLTQISDLAEPQKVTCRSALKRKKVRSMYRHGRKHVSSVKSSPQALPLPPLPFTGMFPPFPFCT